MPLTDGVEFPKRRRQAPETWAQDALTPPSATPSAGQHDCPGAVVQKSDPRFSGRRYTTVETGNDDSDGDQHFPAFCDSGRFSRSVVSPG